MLNFYIDHALLAATEGRISFYENGRGVGVRLAYPPAALIGLRLVLPRMLGTSSVSLLLTLDGEREPVSFPLRLCGCEGEWDRYAVLIDGATLSACGHLFFGRLVVEGIFGRLDATFAADGRVRFVLDGEGEPFPLLLAEGRGTPALLGGAIYALPLRELSRLGRLFLGADDDIETFFSHLSALGVRALWLCPPAAQGCEGERWHPSSLPPAFRSLAEKNGIHLFFDLLCCSALRDSGGMFTRSDSLPLTSPGEGVDDRPGFWNAPSLPVGEKAPSLQEYFCGESGILATACSAGAKGFFLRMADRFGDALLTTLHRHMGEGALLGAASGGPVPIHFGARRRYMFGEALDGMAGDTLDKACLAYLVEGETEALESYLLRTQVVIPPGMLCVQALSCYESGSLLSAIAEQLYEKDTQEPGKTPYALAELGHLIAGTLPGVPMYLAGEENGLPYPPVVGEAVGGQLAFFLRLSQLRRREAVYRDGALRLLHLSPTLLVFSREREGEALLTVINRAPTRLALASPDGFSVVFGGRGLKNVFSVRPYGGIVVKVTRWEGETCRLRFTRQAEGESATLAAPFVGRIAVLQHKK